MKKLFLFCFIVLILGSLIASESEPSDVVGFVKISAPANYWTTLALPFDVNGEMVSSIFSDGAGNPYITGGTNPGLSDQIQEVGGSIAWYNSATSTWMGDTFTIKPGKAYYLVEKYHNIVYTKIS